MPLYTYVILYKGATYVSQARRSNFQGFGDWAAEIPTNALPASQRKQVLDQMYGGFEEVPNRTNVWKKTLIIGNAEVAIVAIQTKD